MARASMLGFHGQAALVTLPSELLEHIGFLLAQQTPFEPPAHLLTLAAACKLLRNNLLPACNYRLWARLFQARFDHQAVVRRLGQLSSKEWTDAFIVRTKAMTSIRKATHQPDQLDLQHLWLAFFMLLEHDTKNVEQLEQQAHLSRYLDAYYKDHLLGDAMQPGYPQETPERTLIIHMQYLLTTKDQLKSESQNQASERFFVLKPYVFAAHRYTAYFAPWTSKLLGSDRDMASAQSHALSLPFSPVGLHFQDSPRVHHIDYFGKQISIRPPPLFQAACLSFSMRADNDAEVTGQPSGTPQIISMPNMSSFSPLPRRRQSISTSSRSSAHGVGQSLTLRLSHRLETPLPDLSSHVYDFTFRRLQACACPRQSPGLDLQSLRGQYAGVWEGRFTFFDFDSYREMLGGRVRSLYEGPLRAQPQIWRIEEHVVEVTGERPEGGSGSALNAGFGRSWEEDKVDTAEAMQRALKSDECMDPDKKYEILLFGVGHSAWGSFVLRGRVRTWDGLFSLAKEYTPDGRGRWLYRGYAFNDKDLLVGRWRDTFTPADINGYEGTFVMQRRNLQDLCAHAAAV